MFNQNFSNNSNKHGAKHSLPLPNFSSQDCFFDYVNFKDILNDAGLPKVSFKVNKPEEMFSLN